MQHLQPNTTVQGGKYKIERVLGQGGFGITYRAVQVALNRRVAIKEFFMKEYCERDTDTSYVTSGTGSGAQEVKRFKEKFLKEAALIAQFDNPHIVRIYDIFEENNTAYYVMEFLEDRWSQFGKDGIPWELSLNIIRQVGDGLSYIHSQNVLHLDVKPCNILFRKDCAVLIDFGISKRYDAVGGQTSTTPVGISKGFAPLEQYNQGVQTFQPATDIYSLGATLYKMLTGETPPEASDVMNYGLPINILRAKQVPERIIFVIQKCMEPKVEQRFQYVSQLVQSLGNIPVIKKDSDEGTKPIDSDKREEIIIEDNKTDYKKDKKAYWGILILDYIIIIISGYLSYYLFNGGDEVFKHFYDILLDLCILLVPFTITFRLFHTYSIFRYSIFVDLGRIALATVLGSAIALVCYQIMPIWKSLFLQHYPRLVLLFLIATLLIWVARIIIILNVGIKRKIMNN